MQIKNITVWKADLGNTKPYTIAFKTVDEVNNAFVEITLTDGTTGIGACSPSEYVTNENLDQTMVSRPNGEAFPEVVQPSDEANFAGHANAVIRHEQKAS